MEEISQNAALLRLAGGGQAGGFLGLSAWGIIAALVFSGVGIYYFKLGKSNRDFFTVFTGLALLIFPYFVTNALYVTLLGSAVIGFHYYRTHYE